MPDTKISALPDGGTPADTDLVPVASGGVTERFSLNQLTAYFEQRGRQSNGSIAAQTLGTTDTYITGSDVLIPTGRLQVRSMYRCRFNVTKSAAGVAAASLNIRVGTAGTTADTARVTASFGAQTAVVDEGFFEIYLNFRTIGATAVPAAVIYLQHRLTSTGLISGATAGANNINTQVGAAFDVTAANLRIGVSVNPGASSSWQVQLVQSELFNLA
jgi:hypothetical protein